ncbi:unnamed protein product [Merluccius merluccius]
MRNFHLKEHRGHNSVSCPHCALVFPSAYVMKRHIVVHTGVRQFVCDFCSRSFNQHGHLKSHLRLHTGEKPYQCQQCDKSFNHNVSLKSHVMRYHKGASDSRPREHTEEQMEPAARMEEVNETEMSVGYTEDTGEVVIDRDPELKEEPMKRIKKIYKRSMEEDDAEESKEVRKSTWKASQRPKTFETAEEDFDPAEEEAETDKLARQEA